MYPGWKHFDFRNASRDYTTVSRLRLERKGSLGYFSLVHLLSFSLSFHHHHHHLLLLLPRPAPSVTFPRITITKTIYPTSGGEVQESRRRRRDTVRLARAVGPEENQPSLLFLLARPATSTGDSREAAVAGGCRRRRRRAGRQVKSASRSDMRESACERALRAACETADSPEYIERRETLAYEP